MLNYVMQTNMGNFLKTPLQILQLLCITSQISLYRMTNIERVTNKLKGQEYRWYLFCVCFSALNDFTRWHTHKISLINHTRLRLVWYGSYFGLVWPAQYLIWLHLMWYWAIALAATPPNCVLWTKVLVSLTFLSICLEWKMNI